MKRPILRRLAPAAVAFLLGAAGTEAVCRADAPPSSPAAAAPAEAAPSAAPPPGDASSEPVKAPEPTAADVGAGEPAPPPPAPAPAADVAPAGATRGEPAPASARRKSLLAALLLQEGEAEGGDSPVGRTGGGGVSVRWSGSGELLWWGRVGGTFDQGIFAERTQNSQFKATHFHLKASASLGRRGQAYVEPCFTHPRVGTQVEQAWLEYTAGERLSIQAGRVLIPFGHWNLIHDVYDHRSISYPLMYKGHEEAEAELRGGPSPIVSTGFSDIGVLLYGSVWLSGDDQLWYGGYVVNGRFGTADIEWLDLWNNQEDNNDNKALGGRLVYSHGDGLTLGASHQTGRFDPNDRLRYRFTGFDVYYQIARRYNLRAEWVRNPVDSLVQGYTKTGWYAMLDFPISPRDEVFVLVSGLRRKPAPRVANMSEYAIGVNRRLTNSLRVKTELNYLRIGNFVGDPGDPEATRFGTDFDDVARIKASLVAIF